MYLIALIGIGLVLHGFILLTIAAFRARPAWGMAVLLVPFAQVFFPIYHWDQARKPFMTFTFGMALWLGIAVVFGQGPLDRYWLNQIGPVQAENGDMAPKPKPLGIEERVAQHKRISKSPVVVTSQQKAYRSPIKTINVKDADHYVGSYARVTLHDGKVHTGEIISVVGSKITLQKSYNNNTKGAMSYALSLNHIARLDVVN